MFFMRVLTEITTGNLGKIICMMQNNTTNKTLFDRTPEVRGDGDLTVGSIIIIINSLPAEDDISIMPNIKLEE